MLYSQYNVNSYPTFLYFDEKGDLVHRFSGAVKQEKFIEESDLALKSDKAFYKLKQRLDNGDRGEQTLYDYVYALNSAGFPYDSILNLYLEVNSNLLDNKTIGIVFDLSRNIKSKAYEFMLENIPQFIQNYGETKLNEKIWTDCLREVKNNANLTDTSILIKANIIVQRHLPVDRKRREYVLRITHLFATGQKEKYGYYVIKFAQLYPSKNSYELKSRAQAFLDNFEEKRHLDYALIWINESIKLNPDPDNLFIKARILFKLREFNLAKKEANKSIKLAKKNGFEYSGVTELLDKIKMEQFLNR